MLRGSIQLLTALTVATALVGAPAAVRAAPAGEDDAAAQFNEAEQLYRDGRYEDAAAILARLAETIPDPVLFYNLGRAHESAGQLEPAIEAYQRYLEVAPDADDAAAVAARVGRLEERVAARDAEAEDEATPEPPPPVVVEAPTDAPGSTRGPGARVAPWVVLGVGGLGVVAGVAVAAVASSKHQDARDEPVQTTAAQLDDEAQGLALAGNVTIAVGGALALAGLTWGVVRLVRDRRRRDVAWTPAGVRF